MQLFFASLLDPLLIIAYLITLIFKLKNEHILMILGGITVIYFLLGSLNPRGIDTFFINLILMKIIGGGLVLYCLRYLKIIIESINNKDSTIRNNQIGTSVYSKKDDDKDE